MADKLGEIIFTEEEIKKRIAEVAKQINADYKDKEADGIFLIGILNGAYMFISDLSKLLDFDFQIEFSRISSYKNALKSSGIIKIEYNMTQHVEGKHILVVEDIIDTGKTIEKMKKEFKDSKAKSFKVCSLLVKENEERCQEADYYCFKCPDKFVVGYGLDYAQKYRNLPYITSLEN